MILKNNFTTIKIPFNLKTKLDKMKIHPNQSYNDLIKNLLKNLKQN
jgi:predicted CopG family antitoxin